MKNLGKIIAGAMVVVLAGTGILMASQNNSAARNDQEKNVASQDEKSERLTREEALEIALDHAGLQSFEVEEIERDNDDSRPVIEIEFRSGSMEYEYTIDAYTGQILEFETERRRDVPTTATTESQEFITKEEALAIALDAAEVTEEDIRDLENEFEEKDNVPSYEIEFNTADSEYEFDIDAKTGEILEFEKDLENMLKSDSNVVKTDVHETKLSKEEALAKALAHAEVEEDSLRDLENELDADDDRPHFDIEFASGSYEYEYDVDAYTGGIIYSEKDTDDDYLEEARKKALAEAKAAAESKRNEEAALTSTTVAPTTTTTQATTAKPTTQATTAKPTTQATTARPTTQATTAKPTTKATTAKPTAKPTQAKAKQISKDQAINIALNHAGVNRSSVYFDDVELDHDDGYLIWEIEFEVGNYEYEYEINAKTGSIIEWEREYDD